MQKIRATDEAKDRVPVKIGIVMIVKNWGVERGIVVMNVSASQMIARFLCDYKAVYELYGGEKSKMRLLL